LPIRRDVQEDAATAEIARCQLWSWVKYGASLDDGTAITLDLVKDVLRDEAAKLKAKTGAGLEAGKVELAEQYLVKQVGSIWPAEFLTSYVVPPPPPPPHAAPLYSLAS